MLFSGSGDAERTTDLDRLGMRAPDQLNLLVQSGGGIGDRVEYDARPVKEGGFTDFKASLFFWHVTTFA